MVQQCLFHEDEGLGVARTDEKENDVGTVRNSSSYLDFLPKTLMSQTLKLKDISKYTSSFQSLICLLPSSSNVHTALMVCFEELEKE